MNWHSSARAGVPAADGAPGGCLGDPGGGADSGFSGNGIARISPLFNRLFSHQLISPSNFDQMSSSTTKGNRTNPQYLPEFHCPEKPNSTQYSETLGRKQIRIKPVFDSRIKIWLFSFSSATSQLPDEHTSSRDLLPTERSSKKEQEAKSSFTH